MNFDGAAKGNLGKAGSGYIIRDSSGNCKAIALRTIKSATNNEVELEALESGLDLSDRFGLHPLDFRGRLPICHK